MNATRAGKNPAERAVNRFKATGRAYVEFALAHPELFEVMFGRGRAPSLAPRDPAEDGASTYALLGRVGSHFHDAAGDLPAAHER